MESSIPVQEGSFYRFIADSEHGPVYNKRSMAESFLGRVDSLFSDQQKRIFAEVTIFEGSVEKGFACTGVKATCLVAGPVYVLEALENYYVYPWGISRA